MTAPPTEICDILVIGAGIAGASVACELAAKHRVLLAERESQPGYHTTGRSAALFSETYGPPQIRALSRASRAFFDGPPAGFASAPLLSPRGVLMIARADQVATLERELATIAGSGAQRLDVADARKLMPLVRQDYLAAAFHDTRATDIDVHALHQGFLKKFRVAGGHVITGFEVDRIEWDGQTWHVASGDRTVRASIVVNAAGAWADEVGTMAGARPVGLVPKRRTALMIAAPEGAEIGGWPMVVDIDEQFYLKPDAGRFLISPADETPSPPCDAQPEELDIAVCIDRIETAFDLSVRRVENKWAGLRSFVKDKTPVAGFDPEVPAFFWLAGQGGYGIQTTPALSRFAAALVNGEAPPADILDQGLEPEALSPRRFAEQGAGPAAASN